MSTRRKHWWIYGGLLLLIGLLIGATVFIGMLTRGGARNIRLGPDTTFIAEPLGPDGAVDYLAAINQMSAAGMTPQDNSAVDLLHAFGPEVLDANLRSRYYAELGMSPLPPEGQYFVVFGKHATAVQSKGDRSDPWEGVMDQKWSAADFPLFDTWLDENEVPLTWIVKASHRSRYYFPLLTTEKSPAIFSALLPLSSNLRDATRLLCIRAMRLWGDGQIDQAFDDCLAALRLTRLTCQSPTLIDSLIATACESTACGALDKLAGAPEATAEQLRRVIDQIEKLPARTPTWQKNDRGERFSYLSAVTMFAHQGSAPLADVLGISPGARVLGIAWPAAIDWNIVMRQGNAWYDEVVRMGQLGDYRQLLENVQKFEQNLNQVAQRSTRLGPNVRAIATIDGRSQLMGDVLCGLMLPAITSAYKAEFRGTMRLRNTLTVLRLSVFRCDHGNYPEQLEQLVPDYCPEVPVDVFDGLPLRYRRTADGFILYSVGPDQTDNGGMDFDGISGDLVVRVGM
jgi:hypothetical protein